MRRPTRRSRFIQFISRVHKSEPIGSREHDNIVDPQLGDREWRAVHKMVVVRSHWPCRLRDRGRSHLVARIWRPTSPDVVPPLDRQFHGMREVRKVREQARILSLSPCLAAAPCPPDPADAERVARAADGADGADGWAPRGHISCCFCLKLHELPSEDDQPPEPVRTVRAVRNTTCTVSPGRRAGLWLLRSRLLLDLAHLDNARSTSIGRFLVKRESRCRASPSSPRQYAGDC